MAKMASLWHCVALHRFGTASVFIGYDASGNKICDTDANGNITNFTYDKFNSLIEVKNAKGDTTNYEYNVLGNKIKMNDANGNSNYYYYDKLGRLIATADPNGDTIYYSYDSAGMMVSKIDANGITINYTYDNLKRLTNIDYPGTDSDVAYTYDANGNRLTMENDWTDFEWTYDVNNKILTQNNNNLNKTIEYTYDANGNRSTMTDGENGITEYTYDDVNRLTQIENPDNENTEYSYGNVGEKLQQTNANGTRTEYNYDDIYRMTLLANKKSNDDTISSFAYAYDNAGNRLSKIYENGDTEIYSYDNLYQLVKVQTKDKTTEYEYDKVGNRIQMKIFTTNDTNITNYNFNADNQLLSYSVNEIDTISFVYDASGNQIAKGDNNDTHYYSYDFENNMIGISALNDTNVISYIYSPDGKRLKKYLNGVGVKYFYDNDDVITEYDTNTTLQVRYTNNLGVDDIISAKRGFIVEQYHKDALGSVTNLTDNSQLSTVNYRYSAFGSIESQSNAHQNEYTYTGRQIDREAGLYYYRSRYYNSEIGRFISIDNLILNKFFNNKNFKKVSYNIELINLYLYTSNNPVRFVDFTGGALVAHPGGGSDPDGTCCDNIGDRMLLPISGSEYIDKNSITFGSVTNSSHSTWVLFIGSVTNHTQSFTCDAEYLTKHEQWKCTRIDGEKRWDITANANEHIGTKSVTAVVDCGTSPCGTLSSSEKKSECISAFEDAGYSVE